VSTTDTAWSADGRYLVATNGSAGPTGGNVVLFELVPQATPSPLVTRDTFPGQFPVGVTVTDSGLVVVIEPQEVAVTLVIDPVSGELTLRNTTPLTFEPGLVRSSGAGRVYVTEQPNPSATGGSLLHGFDLNQSSGRLEEFGSFALPGQAGGLAVFGDLVVAGSRADGGARFLSVLDLDLEPRCEGNFTGTSFGSLQVGGVTFGSRSFAGLADQGDGGLWLFEVVQGE